MFILFELTIHSSSGAPHRDVCRLRHAAAAQSRVAAAIEKATMIELRRVRSNSRFGIRNDAIDPPLRLLLR